MNQIVAITSSYLALNINNFSDVTKLNHIISKYLITKIQNITRIKRGFLLIFLQVIIFVLFAFGNKASAEVFSCHFNSEYTRNWAPSSIVIDTSKTQISMWGKNYNLSFRGSRASWTASLKDTKGQSQSVRYVVELPVAKSAADNWTSAWIQVYISNTWHERTKGQCRAPVKNKTPAIEALQSSEKSTNKESENCFLNSSNIYIENLQRRLKKAKLYNGSIDGKIGPASLLAIKKAKRLIPRSSKGDCITASDYEKLDLVGLDDSLLCQKATLKRENSELNWLDDTDAFHEAQRRGIDCGVNSPTDICSAEKIEKCSDAQTCEQATLLQDSIRRWNLDNIEFVSRAKNLGLDCKITNDATPYSQKEAKYFLAFLTDFASQSPSIFDLEFATRYDSIRPIMSDNWSAELSMKFEEFRLYLKKFPEFQKFVEFKVDEAKNAEKIRMDQLLSSLGRNLTVLEAWAKQNVLDEKAAQVAGLLVAISEKGNQSVNGLEILVRESEALLSATGVKDIATSKEDEKKVNSLFETTSVYVFVNRSGDASSVYKNLDGQTAFEKGLGSYCASDKLDPLDLYILQRKIFELWPNLKSLDRVNCDPSVDVFFARGNEITSDVLYAAVALNQLEQAIEFTKQQRDEEYGRLEYLQNSIEKDVIDGTRVGFGALAVEDSEGSICAILTDKQQAHREAVSNSGELLKIFGVADTQFKDIFVSEDEAFKKLQRQQCGVIYGSSLSLGRIYLAGTSADFKFVFLPLWISPREIDERDSAIEAEKSENIEQLKTVMQSVEDQQKLDQEAQRTLAEKATVRQLELRSQNGLRFTVVKDLIQADIDAVVDFAFLNSPADLGYENKYLDQTFVNKDTRNSMYDELISDVQKLSAEKWEISEKSIFQVDYGSVKFNDREIEGMIVELKIAIKNRMIGRYSEYCKRMHVINDADFEFWREFLISNCDDNAATERWKARWTFNSKWIVLGAQ
jgi:hypothetical protein